MSGTGPGPAAGAHEEPRGGAPEALPSPFTLLLGVRVLRKTPGRAVLALDLDQRLHNGQGVLHGGVYAALIDEALAQALLALTQGPVATTQLDVRFVAPATSGRITCAAAVIHRGRRTAIVQARVRDAAGALLATGTGSFHLAAPPTDTPSG